MIASWLCPFTPFDGRSSVISWVRLPSAVTTQ
uniref:Uncharacterized protein n=1 Tax=Siphoviridae sp. ctETl1 TaxID=2826207 RepID=A0A8S5QUD4_9CAUD|nr:MAG TPA: hypothetical protein [Siphoviridae sp. ctETl1]